MFGPDRGGWRYRFEVSNGGAKGLTVCLEQALQSPDLVNTQRQRARERAMERFSENRMVGEHVALCQGLVGKDQPDRIEGE